MAQVTFVALGTGTTSTNGAPATPAYPVGVATGDLCLLIIESAAPAFTFTVTTTGWSTVQDLGNPTGTNGPRVHLSWHTYTAGDATPVITKAGTTLAGAGVNARIAAYRNAVQTPVLGTVFTSGATTGTTNGPLTGVPITGLGLAVAIGAWAGNYTVAPTLSGWTTDFQFNQAASTVNPSLGIFHLNVSSATSASGTIAWTGTAVTRAGLQIGFSESVSSAPRNPWKLRQPLLVR